MIYKCDLAQITPLSLYFHPWLTHSTSKLSASLAEILTYWVLVLAHSLTLHWRWRWLSSVYVIRNFICLLRCNIFFIVTFYEGMQNYDNWRIKCLNLPFMFKNRNKIRIVGSFILINCNALKSQLLSIYVYRNICVYWWETVEGTSPLDLLIVIYVYYIYLI